MYHCNCPGCHTRLRYDGRHAGRNCRCRSCQTQFTLPQPNVVLTVKRPTLDDRPIEEVTTVPRPRPAAVRATPRPVEPAPQPPASSFFATPLPWICGGSALVLVAILSTVAFAVRSSAKSTENANQQASTKTTTPASAPRVIDTKPADTNAKPNTKPADTRPTDTTSQRQPVPEKPVAEAPPNKTPPVPVPVPVPVVTKLTGDQIHQRLLASAVRIVATTQEPGTPVAAPKPNVDTNPLAFTVWQGSENLKGYGALRFELLDFGNADMIDSKGRVLGSYKVNGKSVTLNFYTSCVYQGTLSGDVLTGTASENDLRWTFTVRKTGALPKPPPAPPPPTPMITRTSAGSGVLVSAADRLVVTNERFVPDSGSIVVHFPRFRANKELITDPVDYPNQSGIRATVVARHPKTDLVLLQLDTLPANVAPVKLAREQARPGQQVHSVGSPSASRALWVYAPGRVRQVLSDRWSVFDAARNRTLAHEAMKLDTDSALHPGDSGGPLVNDDVELVGIAHGLDATSRSFSHFIEVSEVNAILRSWRPKSN